MQPVRIGPIPNSFERKPPPPPRVALESEGAAVIEIGAFECKAGFAFEKEERRLSIEPICTAQCCAEGEARGFRKPQLSQPVAAP